MGQPEIKFRVRSSRNLLGQLRYTAQIVDTLNYKILFSTGRQTYSRRIDAMHAISLVQRYAAIADVMEADK